MENTNEHNTFPSEWFTYHFEDGLWEIISGSFLIELAILYLVDEYPTRNYSTIIVLISLSLLIIINPFLKLKITVPRVGPRPPIQLSMQSKKTKKILIIISSSVVVLCVTLIYLNTQGFITWNNTTALSQFWDEMNLILIIAIFDLISAIVITIKIKKLIIDLVLVSIALSSQVVFYILGVNTLGIPILTAGCCIMSIGVIRLIRFLQKYPKM